MNDLRDTAAFFVESLRYDYADPQLSILARWRIRPYRSSTKIRLS